MLIDRFIAEGLSLVDVVRSTLNGKRRTDGRNGCVYSRRWIWKLSRPEERGRIVLEVELLGMHCGLTTEIIQKIGSHLRATSCQVKDATYLEHFEQLSPTEYMVQTAAMLAKTDGARSTAVLLNKSTVRPLYAWDGRMVSDLDGTTPRPTDLAVNRPSVVISSFGLHYNAERIEKLRKHMEFLWREIEGARVSCQVRKVHVVHMPMDIPHQFWATPDGSYAPRLQEAFVHQFRRKWQSSSDILKMLVGARDLNFCCPTPLTSFGKGGRELAMSRALKSVSSPRVRGVAPIVITPLFIARFYRSRFDAFHQSIFRGQTTKSVADCTHICFDAPDMDVPFLDALTTALGNARSAQQRA